MIRVNKHNHLLSFFIFIIAVLLITRLDYLVNSDLYHYKLEFNLSWYIPYLINIFLLYQMILILLLSFFKDFKIIAVLETFVLSSGQDIIYFLVWNHGVFPEGDWTWTCQYYLLGTWTTLMQIVFTIISTLLVSCIVYGVFKNEHS